LEAAGIVLTEGYANHGLESIQPDVVVIGNALSRGNPAVEYVLDNKLRYQSGPAFIAEHLLAGRSVLAIAGTHGKTTTSSMLAAILEHAGLQPGFLIGGVPQDFGVSARVGSGACFVIEADEYDSAFFDKRSKFVHYAPDVVVINNLEYDHADIFPDLAAIQRQFHHLLRTVPSRGHVLVPDEDSIREVIDQGCWSTLHYLSGAHSEWQVYDTSTDQRQCSLRHLPSGETGQLNWQLSGDHNIANAVSAVAAARCAGVSLDAALAALRDFRGVKRRMECLGEAGGVQFYDDFAHHPTAIRLTLEGARRRFADARIIAVIEPRSNTMRMGVHDDQLGAALASADAVWWCADAAAAPLFAKSKNSTQAPIRVEKDHEAIVNQLAAFAGPGDVVIVMSNGGFAGIHQRLMDALN
ncbi:MAG: UDP-N-acetylmuramate:L-alanyl-gamma-D-glutamyl-meso-diaminopimelate ligase, partial [Pseudomonadales bacterium]